MDIAWHLHRIYEKLAAHLPDQIAGRLDLATPFYRAEWDGPMNGQVLRQELVRNIAAELDFGLVIETGTYRGDTTGFLAETFGCPVWTVEANRRWFTFSRGRLRRLRKAVTVEYGDSRERLRSLSQRMTGVHVFAYLDAHWQKSLPLREEIEIITRAWSHAVIMIDDFQVPDDAGYRFDDYGSGAELNRDYLTTCSLEGWRLSYPAVPSQIETGSKRGCCVLSSPGMDLALPMLSCVGTL
jgi:hypothetical protein